MRTGGAPSSSELADVLEASPSAVEEGLARLGEAHAIAFAPTTRALWMAHPFSAVPTDFQLVGKETSYWANCAWDALAIPALSKLDLELDAPCADCGERLQLAFKGGKLDKAPDGAVVHFLVPPREFWANVGYT